MSELISGDPALSRMLKQKSPSICADSKYFVFVEKGQKAVAGNILKSVQAKLRLLEGLKEKIMM